MKCSKCGAEIKVGSVYCEKCGEPAQIVPDYNILEDDLLVSILEDKKTTTDSDVAAGDTASQSKQTGETKTTPKNKSTNSKKANTNKKNKKLAVIIGCVAALVVILGVTFGVLTSYNHYIAKGKACDLQEDYEGALGYYEKAIAKDSEKITAYYLAGCDYCLLQDYDKAEEYFKLVISTQEDYLPAYKSLIALYLETGDYDALDELQASVTNQKISALFEETLVKPPVFSEKAGKFQDDVLLTLTCEDNSVIYYTDDGTDPTKDNNGILYRDTITLTEGTTVIKAACQKEDGTFSTVVTNKYVVTYEKPDYPEVSPSEGTFTTPTTIYVTIPEGCTVYYTWDGSRPTEASAVCTGSLEVPEGNNILSLLMVDKHGLSSDVLQCNYRYIPE